MDINGATAAIFEFPSQTGDIDHLLISAKVLILAIWSSFFWVLEGNLKIATVAPFIFTLCIPSPKISSVAPIVLAVGGVLYVSGALHLRVSKKKPRNSKKPELFEKVRVLSWAFPNAGLFQKCNGRKEKCA